MSLLSGQIAFEIDDADCIARVVYLGAITDQQVIAFYHSGQVDRAIAGGYGFLIDMRHTQWFGKPDTIRAIALHARTVAGGRNLRIAAVRRDNAEVHSALHGGDMRREFGSESIKYFDSFDAARLWLQPQRRREAG